MLKLESWWTAITYFLKFRNDVGFKSCILLKEICSIPKLCFLLFYLEKIKLLDWTYTCNIHIQKAVYHIS